MPRSLRVLELYCGIGGCAAALGSRAEVVAAVDIHEGALSVYRHNFAHPTVTATLDSLPTHRLLDWAADLWWLSPPCQPFTRRGLGRDDADPRTASLLSLISILPTAPPAFLALENVPGFQESRTHGLLLHKLTTLGYEVREEILCPSSLGVPNRRERYYLVAGREGLATIASPRAAERRPLVDFLDTSPTEELAVEPDLVERYRHALDIVDPRDTRAVAACFTSAYGRSPVRSGSYLQTSEGNLRRFSPAEILRLLGFPDGYWIPADLSLHQAWRLAGNSLSVPAVRQVLSVIPGLEP